jgi:hypothetical protein
VASGRSDAIMVAPGATALRMLGHYNLLESRRFEGLICGWPPENET